MLEKQKLNTKSSCIVELVSVNNASGAILWTQLFIEEQGYDIKENILYRDNKSMILLIENGKKSLGKWMQVVNIWYFFLTDQHEKDNIIVKYCPTDEMLGDYMTKANQGKKFHQFWCAIMGME